MTAVEWLMQSLPSLFLGDSEHYKKLFEQAKEMEKDQIIEAHDAAWIAMNLAFRGFERSVEYYEKTYSRHQEDDNGNL